ncbi:MAG: hypothetical protein ABIB11_01385 [Candidatus Omnitrophota bacterium]
MAGAVKSDVKIISVYCSYLKRTVVLYKKIWYYKILLGHPEVRNRVSLIREILSKNDETVLKYRKKRDKNKIAVFKECPHLRPNNRFIKIALNLLDSKTAVITTVHGVYNLPQSDMEEIK